ncbi:MAG TPA: sugar phosphate isomerase/epimerase family protein [Candidatus Acidoferrales bacterium]|nr:sugar phosphate isomerase/epimerase family protein [Candidatus Acidoferrales bacterium]
MKACLNQDTLRTTPTEKFLRIAKRVGFDSIEFTMDKIEAMHKEGTLAQTKNELSRQKLKVASINGPENFNLLDDGAFSEILNRTDKIVDAAREFHCQLLIPVPSPMKEGVNERATITQTASALTKMADRYGDGVKLGLEFLGMKSCSINNLPAAVETVKRVGKSNVGLVLDSFHIYASDSKFEDVAQLDPKQIFLVHVNDSEPGERTILTDANRLYPGEGVIDLKRFASILRKLGYDDELSLELLRPAYWEQDAEQVAMKGRESMRRVFEL